MNVRNVRKELNVSERASNTFNFVTGAAHKTFLVGIGAMAMTRDGLQGAVKNANGMTGKLAERGETVSNKRREQVSTLVKNRRSDVREAAGKMGTAVETAVSDSSDKVLTRVNIPTADNVDELNKKVGSLGRKIDKMRKEQKDQVETLAA